MIAAVLDASALLAFLNDEPGAAEVEAALSAGAACSAVNYSEVAQKVRYAGGSWAPVAGLLASYKLEVVAMTEVDAVAAADLWYPGTPLSLADHACVATAQRLGVSALTADRAWGDVDGIRQIR
jgi:ribonuclease VapC